MSLLITAGITSCSSDDTVIDIMEEASPQNDAFEIDTIDSATDNVAKVYLSYRIMLEYMPDSLARLEYPELYSRQSRKLTSVPLKVDKYHKTYYVSFTYKGIQVNYMTEDPSLLPPAAHYIKVIVEVSSVDESIVFTPHVQKIDGGMIVSAQITTNVNGVPHTNRITFKAFIDGQHAVIQD